MRKNKTVGEGKKHNLILRLAKLKLSILDFLSPLSLVALRIYVAHVFWLSGLTKLVSWDNTIFLFQSEYMTGDKITFFGHKFITPEMAAYAGTAAELGFSILLILGLCGRFAAFGLLIMTAVIQFTYASSPEHLVWALMLLPILTMGPGKASWDYFVRTTIYSDIHNTSIREKLFAIMCTLCLTLYAAYLVFTDVVMMH